MAQRFEIVDGGAHPGHVLVDERAGLDFVGRFVRDEFLAKGGQREKLLAFSPQKAHVGRKRLIAGAHQIIAIPCLNVGQRMWAVMHAVNEQLRSRAVRRAGNGGDVHQRS